MATPATKSIKVTPDSHRKLKIMAAQSGEHVYQLVDRLVKDAATNSSKAKERGR